MPSSGKKVGIRGKPLASQAREIVFNVLNFFKNEATNGIVIPLKNFKKRTLEATGISDKTYRKIIDEAEAIEAGQSTSFTTPTKKKPKTERQVAYSFPVEATIRDIVHNFYVIERRRPSLRSILAKIRAAMLPFEGGLTSLWRLMHKLDFRWKNTKDNRKALMESYEIRYKRIHYLKEITKYRQEGRPIVYTDESYIHSSHTTSKCWTDDTDFALKKPIGKGRRLIMVHAGGEMGFIPNSLLIFTSGSKSGDYHDDMNATNFFRWLENQLIPNLPARSVLVIDNASYHNVKMENEPVSTTLKKDMIDWLQKKNIQCNWNMTKAELYTLIKQHKSQNPRYKLDDVMEKSGHSVLRLPPYHPELNPIEKIWATVKNWVAARNVTFKLSGVEELAREKFSAITTEEWIAICNNAKKKEEEYIRKEHIFDDTIDNLNFTVNTGSSDEDEPDSDDLCSDSDSDDEREDEGAGTSGIEPLEAS